MTTNLLHTDVLSYGPFQYDWAYKAWETQQNIHWMPKEARLFEDIRDWQTSLTPGEKNLLTQIFRFFTQADVEVADCYMTKYAQVFKPTEIGMMLKAFANMETIHMDAYALLIRTVGMPETEHLAFLKYKEMKDKHDWLQNFNVSTKRDIARTLAAFSGFVEGVQLFASFVILLNFTRFGKMKGMGQIVSWSIRDESLHCESMIKLFRTFITENPEIWDDELKKDIYEIGKQAVELEDSFVDLAFEMGGVQGLDAEEVKQYVRYIADRRLIEMGMKNIFGVKENPLPWVDYLVSGLSHTNFFENQVTEYAKAATMGTWDEAYAVMDMDIR